MRRILPGILKRFARRALRVLAFFLLRVRSRPLEFSSGRLLVVSPHPDDDALGCAGLIRLRHHAGLATSVLYLTDGAASHPGHPGCPPARIVELRRAEAVRSAAILGLPASDLAFLDLPDGRLPHLSPDERAKAVARIARHLNDLSPADVALPLRVDGSSEHTAGHALVLEAIHAASAAASFAPPRVLEFPVWAVWRPTLLLPLFFSARRVHRLAFTGEARTKTRAIAAHVTQVEPLPPWTRAVLPEDFAASFSREEEFFIEIAP